MNRCTVVLVCCLVLISFDTATAGSNGSGWGLGIILGEPTGICAKRWSSGTTAMDFALDWSTSDNSGVAAHADYLRHRFDLVEWDKGQVPFYYGIGIRFRSRDEGDDNIGIRFPLGLDYMFAESTFDAFAELVPIMDVAPDTDFDIGVAIGVRYFF